MTSSIPNVPPAIDAAVVQIPVPMVVVSLPLGGYVRTNPAWEALFGAKSIEEIVPTDDIEGVRQLLQAVADHRLDGYVRTGRLLTADGHLISGHVSLQRLAMADMPELAITVIAPIEREGGEPPPWLGLVGDVATMAVIVTDHDWRIEHVSSDVEALLGYDRRSVIRVALLGLVHPQDAAKLLQTIDEAVTSKHAAIARVRLRAADGSWRELVCLVTALCTHAPPRLAVLLSDAASARATSESARVDELEQHLWRIAMEVRAAGLMRDMGNALPATLLHESAELSGRQWEIVTRLVRGQSVPEIARALYLSQSTVRNHLTAVYRKFGVHSQRELLSRLAEAARSSE